MFARILPALAITVVLAPVAPAQIHKDSRLGFQFKPPKDFRAIALNPTERTTVAKYQSEQQEFGAQWGSGTNSEFEIRFYPSSRISEGKSREEYVDELWQNLEKEHGFAEVEKDSNIKIDRAPAVERHIVPESEDTPVSLYAAVLDQEDGIYVFVGTALKQRFKKYASEFSKAAKSFKRIEKEDAAARDAELSQMDAQERFLQAQIDKLPPGWHDLRTDRYLFLYNAEEGFVKDLAKQIEVIRDKYEELYPPDKPIEAVSIVRVCGSFDEYLAYGGRRGSGGYWSSFHKELVIFDLPPRSVTQAILNHEAFHQYIYYYYGELAPASWYNEGTGDYFAGAKMTKTYRISGFADAPGGVGRAETVKQACRLLKDGRTDGDNARWCATPLKQLLAYTQAEYYDRGDVHYAQGWALIHMLRESKRLKPKWQQILSDYLKYLLEAREEVAQKTMERELEQLEKKEKGSSKDASRDPKDYYPLADTDEIQALAYKKTFADWTDADWEEMNDYYLQYVEKEL